MLAYKVTAVWRNVYTGHKTEEHVWFFYLFKEASDWQGKLTDPRLPLSEVPNEVSIEPLMLKIPEIDELELLSDKEFTWPHLAAKHDLHKL